MRLDFVVCQGHSLAHRADSIIGASKDKHSVLASGVLEKSGIDIEVMCTVLMGGMIPSWDRQHSRGLGGIFLVLVSRLGSIHHLVPEI